MGKLTAMRHVRRRHPGESGKEGSDRPVCVALEKTDPRVSVSGFKGFVSQEMLATALRKQRLEAPVIHNFRRFSRTFFHGYFQDSEEGELEPPDSGDKSIVSELRGTRLPSLRSEPPVQRRPTRPNKPKRDRPKEPPPMAQFSQDLESFLRGRRGKLGAEL